MTLFILLILAIHVQSPGFNLMVFGDTGENEIFRRHAETCATRDDPPVGIPLCQIVTEPDRKKWTCTVTEGLTEPKTTTNINAFHTGLANWERVLAANIPRITAADEVVILGDEVYPESKFMGKPTDSDGGVTWLWPSGPKAGKTFTQEERGQYWEDRRNCGWAAFLRSFDSTTSGLGMTATGTGAMHAKLVAMPGNHLYDVSPTAEVQFMERMFPSANAATVTWYNGNTGYVAGTQGKSWHNSVRMDTKAIANGVTHTSVIFIDFNSSLLELSGTCKGKKEKECIAQIQKALNHEKHFWMAKKQVKAEDVFNHNEGLFYALAAASQVANSYIVLRAHHPPFNLEGDFLAFANYKPFSPPAGWENITVLQAFQKAHVALYLASHHHSAQILAFPYGKAASLIGKPKLTKSSITYKKCLDLGNDCVNTPSYSYNVNWADPRYLFIVLVGNSGRYFDPIETDARSYATLIWGRAGSTADIREGAENTVKGTWRSVANSPNYYYGGAKVNFSDAGIRVRFHEVRPGQTTTDLTAGLLLNTAVASASIAYVDDNVAAKLSRRRNRMKRRHH